MEAKNKIIERILGDAQAKCDSILAQAQEKREQILRASEERLKEQRSEVERDCQQRGKLMTANALKNAELELRKYRLSLKRELIDRVYTDAYNKIVGASANDYLALVTKLLKQYAEKGESVAIATKDSKIITQQLLDKLNLGLKLEGVCDIDGGVVLRGKGYEKDLSISSLLRTVREQSEMEVARILFGEE